MLHHSVSSQRSSPKKLLAVHPPAVRAGLRRFAPSLCLYHHCLACQSYISFAASFVRSTLSLTEDERRRKGKKSLSRERQRDTPTDTGWQTDRQRVDWIDGYARERGREGGREREDMTASAVTDKICNGGYQEKRRAVRQARTNEISFEGS